MLLQCLSSILIMWGVQKQRAEMTLQMHMPPVMRLTTSRNLPLS